MSRIRGISLALRREGSREPNPREIGHARLAGGLRRQDQAHRVKMLRRLQRRRVLENANEVVRGKMLGR